MGAGATGIGTLIPGDDDVSEWAPDPGPVLPQSPELNPRAIWVASVATFTRHLSLHFNKKKRVTQVTLSTKEDRVAEALCIALETRLSLCPPEAAIGPSGAVTTETGSPERQ